MSRKQSGYMVETKDGKIGHTLHSDAEIYGKLLVYLDDGTKRMCKKENLKMIGFKD